MSSPDQSWLKPGLRFCASCIVSLIYWSAWIVLGTSLAALIYVLVSRELPVPGFLLRQAEARLDQANFTVKFGRARLDQSGVFLFEDVQIRSKQFADPLLKSRQVFVKRSIWSILAGRPIPDEIRLEGATLQLPAPLSPSGSAEPVISDLAIVLRHEDNLWLVDQITARAGHLKITAQGEVSFPEHGTEVRRPSPAEITGKFLQMGRRAIVESKRLDAFAEPSLDVRLEYKPGVGNLAACIFSASGAHKPGGQPITLGSLSATTTLRLDGKEARTVRLHAMTRNFVYDDRYGPINVSATINAQTKPETFSLNPVDLVVAASSLTAEGEQIVAPVVRANLEHWPDVKLSTSIQIGEGFIDADIEARLDLKSARIVIAGSGSPEVINRVLAKHTPRAASYFVFGDPVDVTAVALLSPGWRFERMSSRVSAGKLNSHGVQITSARGRIDIEGMNFLAYDAQVEMNENFARGSYWMDFGTTDYRMLLKGRLLPPEISGWFNGEWWTDFWNEHFDFSAALPTGDVDVGGRWKDVSQTEFFGWAKTRQALVWGGRFDQGEAVVFLRPFFTHVVEFNGSRAAGAQQLSGSLKRIADPVTHENTRLEFDLKGNVDPETYHGMLEGKADDILATLQFSTPPQIHAHGGIDMRDSVSAPDYAFTGLAKTSFQYYGFPLENAWVKGRVKGADVQLDEIQLEALGGKGAGKATLTGLPEAPRFGFNLYLNGADLARAIRGVQEYQLNNGGVNNQSTVDNSFIKRATGGRLDVALSAQGIPGELTSFVGTGNAAVTGTNLGEIQLFGLLSQALSGLSFNFSSLKLDAIHSSFRLENGRLRFPDLKVTGPSAVIDARGDFVIDTTALDFTAKFKPFEESRSILTTALGIVINPITSILELKLTGPLNAPKWSIDLGSLTTRHEAGAPEEKNSLSGHPSAK